jgi:hypothetical protein
MVVLPQRIGKALERPFVEGLIFYDSFYFTVLYEFMFFDDFK